MTDLAERLREHAALHHGLADEQQQQWGNELREAAAELDSLRAEVAGLRDDAERYRWLRALSRSDMYDKGVDFPWYVEDPQGLDESIDSARKAVP